jgi:hypothetical protein
MTLTVEDGTGLSDAESYLSVATFKAYCDARGYVYTGKSDAEIEQALRRGTAWLDGKYGPSFTGEQVNGVDQALEWPREDATDARGRDLPDDAVPRQIASADAEAAWRELVAPNSLSPDTVLAERIKRSRKKVGDLEKEIEYADATGTDASRPVVSAVDDILASLIKQTSSSTSVSEVNRA